METANPHKSNRTATTSGSGELVLQNGRQAGARRALSTPATFLGRGANCDIRLNVDGVDAMHCALVHGSEGLQVRDLNSIHGTYVNGVRVDNVRLEHGDLLKVGPFQFRLDLPAAAAPPTPEDAEPLHERREALRVQAAAIAAQQVALEEEETRLEQRRHDLQQQEEQLAAHLAEKQRQVQLWSEYTKTERETLRKEKIEHEKHLTTLEQGLLEAKATLAQDQQTVTHERQRINKIFLRLRQRWQRQWAAEKEKHQNHGKTLDAATQALEEKQAALRAREAAFGEEVRRFNTERELSTRRLRTERESLQAVHQSGRRRRFAEFRALKAKERLLAEGHAKLQEVRQLLVQDRNNWDAQQAALHKELHGLNNRVLHQRLRVQEQEDEVARLDGALRDRRMMAAQHPFAQADVDTAPEAEPFECEVEVVGEAAESLDGLERLAGELADQRAQLIEQYNRLAEIQQTWQQQREQAAAELESLGQRLLAEETALAQRERQSAVVEETLTQRQQETESARRELQAWQTQLTSREEACTQEHRQQMLALRQQTELLDEQLAGIASLRQRWNRRRLQEMDDLRTRLALLDQQQKETAQRRSEWFDKAQQVEEEKRILAEKSLALEQYRQEIFFRAKDPAAQHRVERLRRRWLSLHAALIRSAKNEREAARKELAEVELQATELLERRSQWSRTEIELAEKQSLLDEKDAQLQARQVPLQGEWKSIQTDDDIEILAAEIYEEVDQAA